MPIISESVLENYKKSVPLVYRSIYLNRKNRLNEAKENKAITGFLSHSHSDVKDHPSILEGVIALLSSMDVDVYVDWMDKSMPKAPNAETAIQLNKKIGSSNKFILLASPKAIISNWVNWELGLGDAYKYSKNIALFPFVKNNEGWKDSEYLAIYPYIVKQFNFLPDTLKSNFIVRFPNGSVKDLKDWFIEI